MGDSLSTVRAVDLVAGDVGLQHEQVRRDAEVLAKASEAPLKDLAVAARNAIRRDRSDLIHPILAAIESLEIPNLSLKLNGKIGDELERVGAWRMAAGLRLDVLGTKPRDLAHVEAAARSLTGAGALLAAYDLIDAQQDRAAQDALRRLRFDLALAGHDPFEAARMAQRWPTLGTEPQRRSVAHMLERLDTTLPDLSLHRAAFEDAVALARERLRGAEHPLDGKKQLLALLAGNGLIPDAARLARILSHVYPEDRTLALQAHLYNEVCWPYPWLVAEAGETGHSVPDAPARRKNRGARSHRIADQSPPGHGLAVCVSGQFRGFDRVYPGLRRHLVNDLGADVFFSSWFDPGSAVHEGSLGRALPGPLYGALAPEDQSLEGFTQSFPSFGNALQKVKRLEHDDLIRKYGFRDLALVEEAPLEAVMRSILRRTVLDPELFPDGWAPDAESVNVPVNTLKMVFQIWNADQLVRRAEDRRGEPYRYVVRLRTDKKIARFPLDTYRDQIDNPEAVITNNLYKGGLGVGDQFAVGSSQAMRKYAALWPKIVAAGSVNGLRTWRSVFAESLVYDHFRDEGLSVRVAERPPLGRMMNGPASGVLLSAFLADVMTGSGAGLPRAVLTATASELVSDTVYELDVLEGAQYEEWRRGLHDLGFEQALKTLRQAGRQALS